MVRESLHISALEVTICKFDLAEFFLIFVLVFVSHDFEVGRNVSFEESTGLIYVIILLQLLRLVLEWLLWLCQESSSGPEAEGEVMAFNMKKKFFEQEIENAQQSRPSSAFQSTS